MTVNEIVHEIRDTVNKSIFLDNLKRHNFSWDMVCAAMDMIEDTQLALDAYEQDSDGSDGQHYLKLYGLFQTIFLQQDALVNLADGLKLSTINVWKDPDLSYIRDIRSKYFGHPTKYQHAKKSKATYHGITRMTVGGRSIQGWTYPNFSIETINIAGTLKCHVEATEKILKTILKELIQKGDDYVKQFTDSLPTGDHLYDFEKLYHWAHGTEHGEVMASAAVNIFDKELDTIKTGIEARYEDGNDVLREIKKAKYCLKVLRKGMTESKTDSCSSFYFEVHVDALKEAYGDIRGTCESINEEFSGKEA